jgi:hypothetical protein
MDLAGGARASPGALAPPVLNVAVAVALAARWAWLAQGYSVGLLGGQGMVRGHCSRPLPLGVGVGVGYICSWI